ncbi:MAG: carboxymuconolactone decarboxylase family protein [Acidobacteria bacterium]|nr:carboxymuconolactone decarboxylase family protein [Acidobacteriota bacterium]
MAFIDTIDPPDADGELAAAYERVAGARGAVANILAIHAVTPRVMLAHLDLYREIQFGRSELSRREREMIAVAVSVTNHCHY